MPTLRSIVLGNISVELKYEVDPGEEPSETSDGCQSSLYLADEAVAIIESSQCEKIRVEIDLVDKLSDTEWDRLQQEAWVHWAKWCKAKSLTMTYKKSLNR